MAKVCSKEVQEQSTKESLPFLTVDYIQLACLGGHSVQIQVHENGSDFGNVVVWQGKIWSAQQGFLKGHAALQSMIFSIAAHIQNLKEDHEPGPRNIQANQWQKILLESSLGITADNNEPTIEPVEATSKLAAMDFQELENLALDALLEKRYDEAWEALEYAHNIDPNNTRVTANIERLRALGHGGKE